MIFESIQPCTAGYFQCDVSTQRPPRDIAKHAALMYVSSGQGAWTVSGWKFPVRRGDLFAIPAGVAASAELNMSRPLAYYYCFFELSDSSENSLEWPWDLGPECDATAMVPCASGPFRPEFAAHFRTIQNELSRKSADSLLAARAQLMLLGISFARMLAPAKIGLSSSDTRVNAISLGSRMPESVACVLDYVIAHLEKDLSIAELASIARCSERRLVDIFRNAVGTSPMAYVRERRVFEAQKLLVQGLAVKDVANRLNFADSHHFSRVFRQKTGVSPTEYAAGKAPLCSRFVGEFSTSTT